MIVSCKGSGKFLIQDATEFSFKFSSLVSKIKPKKVRLQLGILWYVLSMCKSDPKSDSHTFHKHWVAILITLSCVFVLQHTGKMWILAWPFSVTMK